MTIPTLAALSPTAMVGNKQVSDFQRGVKIEYASAPTDQSSNVVISNGCYLTNVDGFVYNDVERSGRFLALQVNKKATDTFTFSVTSGGNACRLIDADQDTGLLLLSVNARSFTALITVEEPDNPTYHEITLNASNIEFF